MPSALHRAGAAALATLLATATPLVAHTPLSAQPAPPHNVILFVPDGLRGAMVDATTAPAMEAMREAGVGFANSHSIFPTFTTANASTMATGHLLGDTGDFSNTIYVGYKVPAAAFSMTPFLEADPVIADVDERFGGNYLDEDAILALAHAQGYQTASIGKVGPVAIFDAADTAGTRTLVIDDNTGRGGRPIPDWVASGLTQTTGMAQAPTRMGNGFAGDASTPGTNVTNAGQQDWFLAAATRVVLPAFKASGKPFAMVFWSRDPDGTQHNQGDSPQSLTPGINGPTSLAAIRNADNDLRTLRTTLHALGLDATTDV
ncbi:MAG: alkaline phosphatase family protein, partial [Vulcanimicrobiaceae bacterium]